MDLKEKGLEDINWTNVAYDWDWWRRTLEKKVMNLQVPQIAGSFLSS
jgi:hypothetical protein